MRAGAVPVVVAIPAKDEAERIDDCLRALAWQQGGVGHRILLLLNNCTDETEAVVRALAPALPVEVGVHIATFPLERAHAGSARRLAMELAAEQAGPDGVVLTTDADGRVPPDWIAANLAALRCGAEAVAGRAEIDPLEALSIPEHLHRDDALECAYAELLDQIDQLVDPDPHDPWPRHSEHSGASIAVTCAALWRAGGVPLVPLAEDRALFASLRRVDAAIRHAPEVRVVVSGRSDGRARGGMAETIRRRLVRQDEFVDDRLEPAWDRLHRATLRARFRAALHAATPGEHGLAHDLHLPLDAVREALATRSCGEGWGRLESASPVLRQIGVRRNELVQQTAIAKLALRHLQRTRAARAPHWVQSEHEAAVA